MMPPERSVQGKEVSEAERKVFLCHASGDAAAAGRLVAGLEAGGAVCWISGRDVGPGENFQEAIVRAIRNARALVFLLSDAANRSEEVRKELALAGSFKVPVLPVRVGAVEPVEALRYELATRQWIDAAEVDAAVPTLHAALGGTVAPGPAASGPALLQLPDKPSLVVLPFANLSGDPEQDYLADGMVEDITTALARIGGLFIIARNSAFTYKGRAVDVRDVGRELGVRYVLEGSVRRAAGRLRVTCQLIETRTATQVWSNRFEGAVEDIFDLQDRMADSVVGAIEPALLSAEIERSRQKPTSDLDAYDMYLQAWHHFDRRTRAEADHAIVLLRGALARDPTFGRAMALAARIIVTGIATYRWYTVDSPEASEALALARAALAARSADAFVLANAGYSVQILAPEDAAIGRAAVQQALAINPHSAIVVALSAWSDAVVADWTPALEKFDRALRLSPRDGAATIWLQGKAQALLGTGRTEEALSIAQQAAHENEANPNAQALLVHCLVEAGRLDEARRQAARLVRLFPDFTIGRAKPRPGAPSLAWESRVAALRLVGVPE